MKLAVIPGDGIGTEVVPAAIAVLDAIARAEGLVVEYDWFDWSCERFVSTGAMMPADGLDRIAGHDGILLGAVGRPDVPDHVSLWGLLIPIRRGFGQYVNLRPVRSDTIDLVVVRENTEGEYSRIGGRLGEEMAVQEAVFTRTGVTRIVRYAFELARTRRHRLVSATKSNGIVHTMPFWDEIVREQARDFPDVEWRSEHIDALAAKLVLTPGEFDVIVASNLFGDILSDLAAAVAGSIGVAPSANLNPERRYPSMFEPVHGSAPDIAGQGIANPLGMLWSVAMMLDHLEHFGAAGRLRRAVDAVLAAGVRTPDLGGTSTTFAVADAVVAAL